VFNLLVTIQLSTLHLCVQALEIIQTFLMTFHSKNYIYYHSCHSKKKTLFHNEPNQNIKEFFYIIGNYIKVTYVTRMLFSTSAKAVW